MYLARVAVGKNQRRGGEEGTHRPVFWHFGRWGDDEGARKYSVRDDEAQLTKEKIPAVGDRGKPREKREGLYSRNGQTPVGIRDGELRASRGSRQNGEAQRMLYGRSPSRKSMGPCLSPPWLCLPAALAPCGELPRRRRRRLGGAPPRHPSPQAVFGALINSSLTLFASLIVRPLCICVPRLLCIYSALGPLWRERRGEEPFLLPSLSASPAVSSGVSFVPCGTCYRLYDRVPSRTVQVFRALGVTCTLSARGCVILLLSPLRFSFSAPLAFHNSHETERRERDTETRAYYTHSSSKSLIDLFPLAPRRLRLPFTHFLYKSLEDNFREKCSLPKEKRTEPSAIWHSLFSIFDSVETCKCFCIAPPHYSCPRVIRFLSSALLH